MSQGTMAVIIFWAELVQSGAALLSSFVMTSLRLFERATKMRQDTYVRTRGIPQRNKRTRKTLPIQNKSMWLLSRRAISVHLHVYHHHPHTNHSLSRPLAVAVRCCSDTMPKAPRVYYAVRVGREPGIYNTWLHSAPLLLSAISLTLCVTREDCREQVVHYPRAVFKKLRTFDEATAWIAGELPEDVEQRGTSHSIRSEIKPVETRVSVGSSPLTKASSPPLTITPTPAAGSGSESLLLAGPSNGPLSATAGPSKPTRSSSLTAFEDVVYTDGACSRNGQAGSVAGIGVWWGPSDPRCVFSRSHASSSLTASPVQKPLRTLSRQPAD